MGSHDFLLYSFTRSLSYCLIAFYFPHVHTLIYNIYLFKKKIIVLTHTPHRSCRV